MQCTKTAEINTFPDILIQLYRDAESDNEIADDHYSEIVEENRINDALLRDAF